ncbi:pimeloyl-ACP methyl ester carboxylesterase [Microbacteriaceae bacterium SG_E_30_P1]|uniref:Pimeloyl-ACP methyl ester carboxylesterase n=1 Tax=Antiquaquibacter oligotrophicus TaxID=2880260 RepID=A0ABT6KPA9_9MICO|nr:alpha/beta hydrolase [Antiquaquibacter oligotrophicus]MDH6181830.1 pimeloyl-ACP methyl ester carboxylesterase [Antiquaquibacter oligotrophicus]UDF12493.1 alpha/beta hydrolase [Antiquaquibacter oligotrophicus]
MRRLLPVPAVAVALTLVLTGCMSWFLPPDVRSTSTPTGETVPANLERFYHQELEWSSCGGGLQCATAIAPLDWADPGAGEIELALVRQAATSGAPIGSLLVNPGGPGGSGYDFIRDSIDYATDERLQERFDVVGFDPRGVNRSTPITCYEDPAELDEYLYGIPPGEAGSDEWLAAAADASRQFGERCLELTGPLLGHVDTPSAARDMDMLRAALGDEELNYLGYSYGTLLGQVYADLFPDRTGRLVLDGAVDPNSTEFEKTATQARGFESALRAFLEDCATASDCPFRGSVDASLREVRALLDTLDASPLIAADGRELGSSAMFTAIILPLYTPSNWIYLRQVFTDVFSGDPEYAFQLADNYNGRSPDGTYRDNQTEAFIGINCLDEHGAPTADEMRAEAEELRELAPVLGPQMAWGGTGCPNWPVPAVLERAPIVAEGSADILVIGTTNDPATPYEWAVTIAETLENGHLVTYEGEGHTAYNKSNQCVNDVVDAFFIDGVVPESDPRC